MHVRKATATPRLRLIEGYTVPRGKPRIKLLISASIRRRFVLLRLAHGDPLAGEIPETAPASERRPS
jgi:hypothetical protein